MRVTYVSHHLSEHPVFSLPSGVSYEKVVRNVTYPGRSFRPSETAPYTAGNGYKTAEILPETAKNGRRFSPFFTGLGP
jgi:hypothetical protein